MVRCTLKHWKNICAVNKRAVVDEDQVQHITILVRWSRYDLIEKQIIAHLIEVVEHQFTIK